MLLPFCQDAENIVFGNLLQFVNLFFLMDCNVIKGIEQQVKATFTTFSSLTPAQKKHKISAQEAMIRLFWQDEYFFLSSKIYSLSYSI